MERRGLHLDGAERAVVFSEASAWARASGRSRDVSGGRSPRSVGSCSVGGGRTAAIARREAPRSMRVGGCAAGPGASSLRGARCGVLSGASLSHSAGRQNSLHAQIAATLRAMHPDEPQARVSHETHLRDDLRPAARRAEGGDGRGPAPGQAPARCRSGDRAQAWGRQCHRPGILEDYPPARGGGGPPRPRPLGRRPPEGRLQPLLGRHSGRAQDPLCHPCEDGRQRRCGGSGRLYPPDETPARLPAPQPDPGAGSTTGASRWPAIPSWRGA
jgi:hypothetical protein